MIVNTAKHIVGPCTWKVSYDFGEGDVIKGGFAASTGFIVAAVLGGRRSKIT